MSKVHHMDYLGTRNTINLRRKINIGIVSHTHTHPHTHTHAETYACAHIQTHPFRLLSQSSMIKENNADMEQLNSFNIQVKAPEHIFIACFI